MTPEQQDEFNKLDQQIIDGWRRGFNTEQLARHLSMPECDLEPMLWRLLEQRRIPKLTIVK